MNFAAIITRLDIIKAISRLSKFLRNLSLVYLAAANRVIVYLYGIKTLIIKYSRAIREAEVFIRSFDTVFTNDIKIRYSS